MSTPGSLPSFPPLPPLLFEMEEVGQISAEASREPEDIFQWDTPGSPPPSKMELFDWLKDIPEGDWRSIYNSESQSPAQLTPGEARSNSAENKILPLEDMDLPETGPASQSAETPPLASPPPDEIPSLEDMDLPESSFSPATLSDQNVHAVPFAQHGPEDRRTEVGGLDFTEVRDMFGDVAGGLADIRGGAGFFGEDRNQIEETVESEKDAKDGDEVLERLAKAIERLNDILDREERQAGKSADEASSDDAQDALGQFLLGAALR